MRMTDEQYVEKVYNSNHKNYPEVLTLDEADEFENFKTFTNEGPYNNLRAAVEFAKKVSGIVYTQVDGDDGSVLYGRGFHLVNRTGVYAVAWKPKLCRFCHHPKNSPQQRYPKCRCSCHRKRDAR